MARQASFKPQLLQEIVGGFAFLKLSRSCRFALAFYGEPTGRQLRWTDPVDEALEVLQKKQMRHSSAR